MKYYLAAVSAFTLWGFTSLAIRPLASYSSSDILFYRVVFAFLIVFILNIFFRKKVLRENGRRFLGLSSSGRKKTLFLTFLGGLFLTSNWFFFIFVINRVSVKAASFSYLVCPIVTMVLANVFLKEKLSAWQWAAVGLSALGCWLLSLGHWEDVIYSLIVAFSYGAYLVSQRANSGFDSLLVLNVHVFVALLFLAALTPFYSFAVPSESFFYQYMLLLVVFLTVVPLALNLVALKGVSSSTMGMLIYVNPVINFAVAVLCFGEKVTEIQLVSYGIIVVSILLFNKELIFGKPVQVK